MKQRIRKSIITLTVAAAHFFCTGAYAAAPVGYYDPCVGKCGAELLAALMDVIGKHTTVSYSGLWTVYKDSDVYPEDGKIWDMYSTKHWNVGTEQCGNVGSVLGVCYNREHSMPKSWFNDASPMVSDAFHIYPTDGKVNGVRSNMPYGECANGTIAVPDNGNLKALGKKGKSTVSGYSGTVFEPDDQYKGDFARTYFYMAACYNDRIASWSSDMLNRTSYPVFTSWAQDMLLKWHRADIVSAKEINRNDAVYKHQKNRNPFIDHPELAEHIWGNKKTEPWQGGESSTPQLLLPVDGSDINLGMAGKGVTKSLAIAVKGSNLSAPLTISVSGTGFSIDKTSISASAANATSGTTLTISFNSSNVGSHYGTLSIYSDKISTTANLSATVADGIPADEATSISETGFVAHWTYVGGDTNGFYTLNVVTTSDNNPVEGYPAKVNARAQLAAVNGLQPDTEYAYTISSSVAKSATIKVRTAVPQPSVYFYSEEDFAFNAAPGEASEPQEIGVEIVNIESDVTISVSQPFEISEDRTNWSQTIDISPEADRFYMRFAPSAAGIFTTSIRASSGSYFTDDAEVTGIAAAAQNYLEDFEQEEENTSYSTGEITGTMGLWHIEKCGIISENGSLYVRTAKTGTASSLTMMHDKTYGIGTVTVEAAAWSTSEGGTIRLDYSSDGGLTWSESGSINITSTTRQNYTFTVNRSDANRIRITRVNGGRHKIDNIAISDFHTTGIPGIESDYAAWDAYCIDGRLTILAKRAGLPEARVYGTDGILYASLTPAEGTTALSLPTGLYIVVIEDFTRRVVVR